MQKSMSLLVAQEVGIAVRYHSVTCSALQCKVHTQSRSVLLPSAFATALLSKKQMAKFNKPSLTAVSAAASPNNNAATVNFNYTTESKLEPEGCFNQIQTERLPKEPGLKKQIEIPLERWKHFEILRCSCFLYKRG